MLTERERFWKTMRCEPVDSLPNWSDWLGPFDRWKTEGLDTAESLATDGLDTAKSLATEGLGSMPRTSGSLPHIADSG